MCTAVTYKTKDFYFGRTLDYDCSFGEEITVTPRDYPFYFQYMEPLEHHFAMIGMAHVQDNFPLYYDGVNEKGLGMAGLNFVGNAVYNEKVEQRNNVAVYEFIPWILGQCKSVEEAKEMIDNINLTGDSFHGILPAARLHWILADSKKCIVVESVRDGIRIFDNPVGILTNNPPFEQQIFQLNNYMHLSAGAPENHFSDKISLHAYSRGMGALGLPGDLSSQSRFVRAAFVKLNSVSGESEAQSVSQFFHILGAVEQQRGCCDVERQKYEVTIYTSCCNAEKGIYYYTTYDNHQISAVDMYKEELDAETLICYPLIQEEQINVQN